MSLQELGLKRLKPARPLRCGEYGPLALRDGKAVSISEQGIRAGCLCGSKGQKTISTMIHTIEHITASCNAFLAGGSAVSPRWSLEY